MELRRNSKSLEAGTILVEGVGTIGDSEAGGMDSNAEPAGDLHEGTMASGTHRLMEIKCIILTTSKSHPNRSLLLRQPHICLILRK